jgi:prenyltransferase beta subunit
MLGAYDLVDSETLLSHTFGCETSTGGFSKCPNTYPDVMHTYFALCGLSLAGFGGLKKINCMLGFSV